MERILTVGLEENEVAELRERLDGIPVVAHVALPRIIVDGGTLLVERNLGPGFLPVSVVLFHSIFADDLEFLAALALWGGPCLPNARAMLDCRLKLPCLVRALQFTRFGGLRRAYASPDAPFSTDTERVAKWGNWHCGENKERFIGVWRSDEPSLIEPFVAGESVRVVVIGERSWQIRLAGTDWRKSIHDDSAAFMDPDPELVADTFAVGKGFGLELLANDYIIAETGERYLLETNHIPNVNRFRELWEAYRDYAAGFVRAPIP